MTNCNKKPVTKQQIDPLCTKYNINQILASIFVRRGITEGKDLLYYLEDDLRFQHNPFMFSSMEDAVERIIQAKEEEEKILIFGDSDVDGITSTAILYSYLKNNGYDVQWKLPLADDPYGLNITAIDEFYNQNGSLIITVDCGISNFEEIKHANDLQIDVIVTDHHNPPEILPEAVLILDPKTQDSEYPFHDISGAAVAYKLVSALRFAETNFYNAEICLMDIQEDSANNCLYIDCIKIKNLVKIKQLHEKISYGTSIYNSKLISFLQGQLIYSWNAKHIKKYLNDIFGFGVEFNILDFSSELSSVFPQLATKSLSELVDLSSIGKYIDEERTPINAFFNLYVTYTKRIIASKHSKHIEDEIKDLQLVGLAALADIMPMKDENRLFVKNGISSMKKNKPRQGLAELFAKLSINVDSITSTDLSWTVIPALNAAGRLGQSNIALELLISENPQERESLAVKICELNEQRKDLVAKAVYKVHDAAEKSVSENQNKLCVVIDEEINKGVTGIFAARLMQDYDVPAIAVTFIDDICIGSMRSCRNFIATDFLDSFGDFFINHGGHDYAAGFSFERSKLDLFLKKIKDSIPEIQLSDETQVVEIDAEIPANYLKPDIFEIIDTFEPYGAENPELLFMSKNILLSDAMIVGKKEPLHLKLTFNGGEYKFPAMYWGKAERYNKDISINNFYDIIYKLNRSYFNGLETKQLTIRDIQSPEIQK